MEPKVITASCVKSLYEPAGNSHKGENGVITVVGGSGAFHGAPILSVLAASRFCDIVYFHSPEKGVNRLLEKMRLKSRCFIAASSSELKIAIAKSDAVLIGNGMPPNSQTKKMVNLLLRQFPSKKWVIDGGALRVVERKLLSKNCIVTPHASEYKALFGVSPNARLIQRQAQRFGATILLKGEFDFVSDGDGIWRNITGNSGMTKGGTGDVLAGLAAALYSKNEPLASAKAAAYINGLAGDLLFKRAGYAFNADDLACELPAAYQKALS